MRFDADFLAELKQRNDITDLISAYLPLKKSGSLLSGLCPFHTEKTPSFMVYPRTQSYYCFGCGAGGDVITFVMARENLDYVEAIRFLCDRCGMTLPEDEAEKEWTNLRSRILSMNRDAAKFFYQQLLSPRGEEARNYLKNRGFEEPILKRFGVGFAPDSWQALTDHLHGLGYHDAEILQGWLAGRSQKGSLYDQFRNRVMFPVFDLRGNVIGFSGRTLSKDDPRKYLNSGDTPVFQKSRNLFAMNFAKNKASEFLLVCEGNLDVVAMHKSGFENAVASLGTALTEEQVRIMASYTNEVVLAYDSDGPGQKATKRAIGLLQARGLQVRVLSIPDAKDPDEYIKKFGAVRFARLVAESKDATAWEIDRQKADVDLSDPAQKGAYIRGLLPTLADLSFVEQDIHLSRLSEELNIAKEALAADLRNYIWAKKHRQQVAREKDLSLVGKTGYDKLDPERNRHFQAATAEELLLGYLLSHPEFYAFCQSRIQPSDFIVPLNGRIAEALFENLGAGGNGDLSLFRERFTDREVGFISGLLAKLPPITDPEAVLSDCITTIQKEKGKKSREQVANLEDDDLRAFIAGLGNKKHSPKTDA